METLAELTKRLLTPPRLFTRAHGSAFLYTPYSRINFRRVYCYTHLGYDLWAQIESDSDVIAYNVEVPPIPIAVEQQVRDFTPACIARKRDGSFTVFAISQEQQPSQNEQGAAGEESLMSGARRWASKNGFDFVQHTRDSLRAKPVHLENLKTLLRYVCVPDRMPSPEIKEQVEVVIRQSRSTTVDHVVRSLPSVEEQWLMIVIADLILKGTCYSDIDRHPFHYSTEMSLHHAIP